MRCRAGLSVAVATDARDEQRKRGEHTKCSKETSACSPVFEFSCKRIWKGCIYINLSVYIHAIHPGHFGFKTNTIISATRTVNLPKKKNRKQEKGQIGSREETERGGEEPKHTL